MAGEQRVTLSATGATSVEIWTTKLDHNLDKPIVGIAIPRQKSAMASTGSSVYLIDLGRVNQVISVTGFFVDDATSSALTKKKDCITLIERHRVVTLTWGTNTSGKAQNEQSVTGNIQKVNFTETVGKIVGSDGEATAGDSNEKNYAVTLSFLIGTDK